MIVLGGTLCLSGCFTIEHARTPNGEDHIVASNTGWYLFNFLPVGCGNSSKDPHCPFVVFRDDVTMEKIQDRMIAAAEEQGKTAADLSDLVYTIDDDNMLTVPLFYFEIPIPYLLTRRTIQLSGVAR